MGSGTNDRVLTTAIQDDGKIIIGGQFTTYSGIARNYIARLNTDGSLDSSFNPGTGTNGYVLKIAIQTDGKIIIGGLFSTYNDSSRNCIARLNTDGSLDSSFNVGTGASNEIWALAIQSDGKIIIGGQFAYFNGTAINCLARLNTDGTLDTSFNVGTGAEAISYISTIAIQSDGKIIIGGGFSTYNGTARNCIARLTTNGSLDTSFIVGAGANNNVQTTVIQSDGKIIIGGYFTSYNGTASNYISRLNTDGSLDTTFKIGTGTNSTVFATTIQADGKIIIGGGFTSYNGTAINFTARLNIDGNLDGSFNIGTGPNSSVRTITLQSNGKIIIGGYFTTYDGTFINQIARLNNTISTGITNYAQTTGLSIFPNPNNGDFSISINQEETFALVNNLGQTIQTVALTQGNNNSATISGIEPGIYFLVGKSNALLNYKVVVGR